MTQTISEMALQLLDHISILIDESQHLEEAYFSKLEKMEAKMNIFITEFYKHSAMSIQDYASYLNHDALSQLTFILGYAELFRSVNAHLLKPTAIDVLEAICTGTRNLSETLRSERDIIVAQRDQLT